MCRSPTAAASLQCGTPDEALDTDLLATLNARTARRQRLAIGGIGAVLLAGAAWYMFGTNPTGNKSDESKTIDTAGIVNRDLSQREFVAVYGNRLDAVARQQKELKDASIPRTELEQQMAALKAENQAMRTDGQAAIDAITAENTQLKSQLAANAQSAPAPQPTPTAFATHGSSYRRGVAPANSSNSGSLGGNPVDASTPGPAEVKLMSFSGDKGAAGVKVARPDAPPLVVEDSPEYLPPNSYAPARVIVGVDASAGVASQTDPLPVMLRIAVLVLVGFALLAGGPFGDDRDRGDGRSAAGGAGFGIAGDAADENNEIGHGFSPDRAIRGHPGCELTVRRGRQALAPDGARGDGRGTRIRSGGAGSRKAATRPDRIGVARDWRRLQGGVREEPDGPG